MVGLAIFNSYIIGQKIYSTKNQQTRNVLLGISLLTNIGILFIFKYFNFFLESFYALMNTPEHAYWNSLNIILPVGISFYTFQTLSYTIDIYRRKMTPTRSILTFFTFVAFFPQLVAGPIERAERLIPQFKRKLTFSSDQASNGLKLILWGLFKKMVIADQIAVIVNLIYESPQEFNGIGILIATFLFGFQIYCDFSGYSDIAIGTAKLFGIELMTNFKTPFFASSIREFWQRWHISLSTWFRDYVYIPLGGNRKGELIRGRNILLTFVVSGLWHGANFTFILWGFVHGLTFVFEKRFSLLFPAQKKWKTKAGWLITFLIVGLSWIFFRAESLEHLKILVLSIINNFYGNEWTPAHIFNEYPQLIEPLKVTAFALPLFIGIEAMMQQNAFDAFINTKPKLLRWSFYYILIVAILLLGVIHSAPEFIYFQF